MLDTELKDFTPGKGIDDALVSPSEIASEIGPKAWERLLSATKIQIRLP